MGLTLTRRVNESIRIPVLGIVIEVVSVRRGSVKIRFQGPKFLRILRGELKDHAPKESLARMIAYEKHAGEDNWNDLPSEYREQRVLATERAILNALESETDKTFSGFDPLDYGDKS